ncbi:uracil nucleotide/cysteinyl leukotriene receptor [Protopterus annectens]|uniref:uracil nucleotide/cysteinyl leukotriene receptor n=1 Tax=Protopterus annectens TaxID=7888 RepID=UPI001CFC0286|nr:uracil nucleotide/cysteinyl leukotriene receptor [Protopterus annectens]
MTHLQDQFILPSNSNQEIAEQCIKETGLENAFFAAYYLLDFILAFLGNTLALWIFIYDHKSGTPANIFLMHLAVADLSYVLTLPLRLVYHLTAGHWPFGELACRFTGFLFYLNMYASIYFMAYISVDRFFAIVYPVKSITVRKPLHAHLASITLWVLVGVAMAPLLATAQTIQVNNVTICLQLYREKASRRALASLAIAFTIPFIVILFSYLMIVQSLKRGNRIEKHLKDKAIQMISLVLAIFLVCFVPYHVNRFVYILLYDGASCDMQRILALSNRITSCLTSLNGALDPVLYFFVAEKFRETFRRLICGNRPQTLSQNNEAKTNESSLSAKSEL